MSSQILFGLRSSCPAYSRVHADHTRSWSAQASGCFVTSNVRDMHLQVKVWTLQNMWEGLLVAVGWHAATELEWDVPDVLQASF